MRLVHTVARLQCLDVLSLRLGLSACCLEQPARLLHLQSSQKRTLLPADCSIMLTVHCQGDRQCLGKLL